MVFTARVAGWLTYTRQGSDFKFLHTICSQLMNDNSAQFSLGFLVLVWEIFTSNPLSQECQKLTIGSLFQ
jgi:hypothetical protein